MQLFMELSTEIKLKEGEEIMVALEYLNYQQCSDMSACFQYVVLSKFNKHVDLTLVDL